MYIFYSPYPERILVDQIFSKPTTMLDQVWGGGGHTVSLLVGEIIVVVVKLYFSQLDLYYSLV